MYPDPNFAQSNILGQRFTLMDGIVGLAFDASAGMVYFQPLATDRIFSVPTSALRAGPLPFGAELPVRLVGKKSSQGIGLAVSPADGSIFFSPMSETAVAKWNPTTNQQKVLAFDTDKLQFVADIRTPARDPGAIYVLSSRFHRFFLKNLDTNEINTRIMRIEDNTNVGIAAASTKIPPLAPAHSYGRRPTFGSLPTITTTSSVVTQPSYVSDSYFNSIRQPYRYESVGIINKQHSNPFAALNTGERPDSFGKLGGHARTPFKFGQDSLYGGPSQTIGGFNDFNGLRVAKSTSYNTSVQH